MDVELDEKKILWLEATHVKKKKRFDELWSELIFLSRAKIWQEKFLLFFSHSSALLVNQWKSTGNQYITDGQ